MAFIKDKFLSKVLVYLPPCDYEIGVHQIRVVADDQSMGIPAPEGIHQDGFDYIAILSVNNQNLAGGVSILLSSQNPKDIIFEQSLQPSNCLLLNDRNLFHYVSPIVPKLPGNCFRDMIITTFSIINKDEREHYVFSLDKVNCKTLLLTLIQRSVRILRTMLFGS
ncbi:MAG: hypothetical protein EBT45_07625 [Alphaproteobacteria bacterium]|nr:hypothetical protein [Alphaproteobacteria bacterium]